MTKTELLRVIRTKCMDCCCGSYNEVILCTAENCPLHPFRQGKDPYKRKLSDAQLEELRKGRLQSTGFSKAKTANAADVKLPFESEFAAGLPKAKESKAEISDSDSTAQTRT